VPAAETADSRSPWFLFPDHGEAERVLFCLPHSGGGASAYRAWLAAFPPAVSVRPLQPPGRESRFGEAPTLDVAVIADVVSREERRYAIYGHSLGAMVAFEVARKLQQCGGRGPERLFVGACRAPWQAGQDAARLLALSDAELVAALTGLGGMPSEIAGQTDLLRLLMPLVRSDFGWMAEYTYRREPSLRIPVVAIAGAADRLVPAAAMADWSEVTSAGFALRVVPGEHFFVQAHPAQAAGAVISEWPVRVRPPLTPDGGRGAR
jgi:surfactin synthase thioesterase subunit